MHVVNVTNRRVCVCDDQYIHAEQLYWRLVISHCVISRNCLQDAVVVVVQNDVRHGILWYSLTRDSEVADSIPSVVHTVELLALSKRRGHTMMSIAAWSDSLAPNHDRETNVASMSLNSKRDNSYVF